ncbi:MAG: galactonate dehydratase [Candidatus Latescibacteria bacterium]|nr:galactonate dehydratase [Candidatus Latescibacterota bacterium]
MTFLGYPRARGAPGIRNCVAVIAVELAANPLAARIADEVRGAAPVLHKQGIGHLASDQDRIVRVLRGWARNPNVGAALFVDIGYGMLPVDQILDGMDAAGKPVEIIDVEKLGGLYRALEEGVRLASAMAQDLSEQTREPCPVGGLTVALKCAGSDTLSALTANPACGAAVDRLMDAGGVAFLCETPEMIGAEHLLAARAATPEIARQIEALVRGLEETIRALGVDIRGAEPVPANIEAGLTTLEEKSLGAIMKGGTRPIRGVLDYGQPPRSPGLHLMDTPAGTDKVFSGVAAAGAHLVVGTAGAGPTNRTPVMMGTDTVFPFLPLLKVTSSPRYARDFTATADVDAGPIARGEKTIQEVGEEIYHRILRTASGRLTASETLGRIGTQEIATHYALF